MYLSGETGVKQTTSLSFLREQRKGNAELQNLKSPCSAVCQNGSIFNCISVSKYIISIPLYISGAESTSHDYPVTPEQGATSAQSRGLSLESCV